MRAVDAHGHPHRPGAVDRQPQCEHVGRSRSEGFPAATQASKEVLGPHTGITQRELPTVVREVAVAVAVVRERDPERAEWLERLVERPLAGAPQLVGIFEGAL